jgi:protein TonB
MDNHADILDQQDSLRGPLVQSVLLHGALVGAFVLGSVTLQHSHEVWGSAQTAAGSAVAINAVKSIPLPSRPGRINPVAHDTESQVPQAPKPEPKRQVKVEDEKAIPLARHRVLKPQPRQQALQRYHPEPPPRNQVFSDEAPAAVTPMIQKAGTGGVGVAPNSTFGTQFGGYANLVVQRVTDKWQTNGLAGMHLPMVVITFDILRDGSVRNPQIAQRSGNSTLDYSALRAVSDAAPFPPLPPQFSGNSTNVELRFQLQQ